MQSLTLLVTAAASSRSAFGRPSRGRKIALSSSLRARVILGVSESIRKYTLFALALEAKELRCASVSSSSAGTSIQGSHCSCSRVKRAGRRRPLGVVPPCCAERPRVRGVRVGRGHVGAAERGETGEEALEVALEGDELADQHHRGRLVARRGEALLIGGGDQRRGGRQQVHMVAEGLEGGIVRDRIGGDQGLL